MVTRQNTGSGANSHALTVFKSGFGGDVFVRDAVRVTILWLWKGKRLYFSFWVVRRVDSLEARRAVSLNPPGFSLYAFAP